MKTDRVTLAALTCLAILTGGCVQRIAVRPTAPVERHITVKASESLPAPTGPTAVERAVADRLALALRVVEFRMENGRLPEGRDEFATYLAAHGIPADDLLEAKFSETEGDAFAYRFITNAGDFEGTFRFVQD